MKYWFFLAFFWAGCGRVLEIPPSLEPGRVDPLTEEAIEKTREFLLANPRDPSAWANLGMVLVDGGLSTEPRKCFENANYLDPKNPRFVYLLGWSFLPDAPEKARYYFQNANQLAGQFDPENPAPALRLAETLRALGLDLEAKGVLIDGFKHSGNHPLASLMLAEIAAAQGEDKVAQFLLAKIPDAVYLVKRKRLLDLTLRFGANPSSDFSKKMEEIRLMPQDPEWPDPYLLEGKSEWLGFRGCFRLAEALEAKGRLQEAASLLQKIWGKTKDPRSRVGLVGCLLGTGKWEEAKTLIEVLPQSPHNPVLWARYHLAFGDSLAEMGKQEQARFQFLSGLEKLGYNFSEGELLEALGLRCRLLWRLESWKELEEASSRFLVRQPFHKGAKAFLCLSQLRLNQPGKDCDLGTLVESTYPEGFPETEQILKILAKTGLPRSNQGKNQP